MKSKHLPSQKKCKCNKLDHYKCTRIEDHQDGKHLMKMWWCELCFSTPATSNVANAERECNHKYIGSNNILGKPCYYCGQNTEPVGEEVKGWEKEFDKVMYSFRHGQDIYYLKERVLSFLSEELARQKKELVEKVKMMIAESQFDIHHREYEEGYLNALESIVEELEKEE